MWRSSILLTLFVAVTKQTSMDREVLQPGSDYSLSCGFQYSGSLSRDEYFVQFFKDRTEVKMFNTKTHSDTLRVISNDTTVDPLITEITDRYSVEEDNNRYTLKIKNVSETDSAWYGCRIWDLTSGTAKLTQPSRELFIPGPLLGIFWSTNTSALDTKVARKHEIPDGGIGLADNDFYGSPIGCVILASNLEPVVNITIGHPHKPGSINVTDQYDIRISSVVRGDDAGVLYRENVFFKKKFSFKQKSIRDLYCMASLMDTTFIKSANLQIRSKPEGLQCSTYEFYAMAGDKNVNLSCLIMAHPEPEVTWIIPDGTLVRASSNNMNYTVTNKMQFEGLLTTLTITEVPDKIDLFKQFSINATNSEGSGTLYVQLTKGHRTSGAPETRAQFGIMLMALCFIIARII